MDEKTEQAPEMEGELHGMGPGNEDDMPVSVEDFGKEVENG